jgi:signal transduction histidine kinase
MRQGISVRRRLIAASLRPRSRDQRRAAWITAFVGPAFLTLAVLPFGSFFGLASVMLFMLLVVIAVAITGGVRPALTTVAMGLVAGVILHLGSYGLLRMDLQVDVIKLGAFVVLGVSIVFLIDELTRAATEQTALRRVATLVARGAPDDELFAAVAAEVGKVLSVDLVQVGRFGTDGTVMMAASWNRNGVELPIETTRMLGGHNVSTLVARTGRPARINDYETDGGGITGSARGLGSSVGSPIIVEGRLWGVMIASSTSGPVRRDTEAQLADLTDLVATAIANAEGRAELAASRARVVAAADETRRRIERDLHDGTQQRLVSLGLELRGAEASIPPALTEPRRQLSRISQGLTAAVTDLQEISRGIHPAILSKGGLGPAIRVLARRSAIPIELDVHVDRRLPDSIEVAAYYVVSEALTNVTKHAHASVVHIDVKACAAVVRLSIRDDGIGGPDPSQGSGLLGLRDRVETLGGTIEFTGTPGQGTSIIARIPIDPELALDDDDGGSDTTLAG